MGSADHQFHLTELLSQNYSLREGCAEAQQCPDKPEEELGKDFIDQVWGLTSLCPVALPWLHGGHPMLTWCALLAQPWSLLCSPKLWRFWSLLCLCTAQLLGGPDAGVLPSGDLPRSSKGA